MLLMYRSNIDCFFFFTFSTDSPHFRQNLKISTTSPTLNLHHQQVIIPSTAMSSTTQPGQSSFFFYTSLLQSCTPSCIRIYRTLCWWNVFGKWLVCQLQFIRCDYIIKQDKGYAGGKGYFWGSILSAEF